MFGCQTKLNAKLITQKSLTQNTEPLDIGASQSYQKEAC